VPPVSSAATLAKPLLDRSDEVIGVDSLSGHHDPTVKRARLDRLTTRKGFAFHEGDIADPRTLAVATAGRRITKVLHLAAQAGVRYSLENPRTYVRTVSDIWRSLSFAGPSTRSTIVSTPPPARSTAAAPHRLSAIYRVDRPVSLCAATKIAGELMGQT
jgi:UDP-glucuronate 4-epimerase